MSAWTLAKDPDKIARLATVLYNLLESVRIAGILLEPFLPETSAKILAQLNTKMTSYDDVNEFGLLETDIQITDKPEILFARLDEKEVMIWALFSLYTDPMERRRKRLLAIGATIASVLSGTLLPLELMLLVLCPLLFFFHLGFSGILFGVLQAMHCYLGYDATSSLTISALPGSLPEFLTYLSVPSLQSSMIKIVIVGVISMLIYFFMTRFYFKHGGND